LMSVPFDLDIGEQAHAGHEHGEGGDHPADGGQGGLSSDGTPVAILAPEAGASRTTEGPAPCERPTGQARGFCERQHPVKRWPRSFCEFQLPLLSAVNPIRGGFATSSTRSEAWRGDSASSRYHCKPKGLGGAFCERQPPLPHDRGIGKGGSASVSTQSFNKAAAFCELPLPLLSAENRGRRGFCDHQHPVRRQARGFCECPLPPDQCRGYPPGILRPPAPSLCRSR
jgi:hypothetical protein